MDKKERFLLNITQRRMQSLLGKYEAYTRELHSLCHNLISRLTAGSSEDKLVHVDPGLFVCDQSLSVITHMPAKYALAVSDYTAQALLNKSDASSSPSTILQPINSPEINRSRSLQDDSSTDLSRSIELARLASCKRVTTLLDMNFTVKEAVLKQQIELLSQLSGKENLTEALSELQLSDDEDLTKDEEHLETLKERYAQLARELAYLDTLEIKQAQLDAKRTRQKKYVDRLHKILDAVAFENAWLQLVTDLIQLEAASSLKLSKKLQETRKITESLLTDGKKFLTLLSSTAPSTSQLEHDKLSRLTASQQFEHTVREVLRNCASPQTVEKLATSTDSEELLLVLDELKSKLAQDETSSRNSSNYMLSHSHRLNEQFKALTETLCLPSTSQSESGHSQPHLERVSGARLRETFTGLCAPEVIDFFTTACSHLDQLSKELSDLREQANFAFSL